MIDYDPKSFVGVLARFRGTVLPHLIGRTLACAGIGAGAMWLYQDRGWKIPTTAHTLIGVALGLLLVFRTNTSYDRFWEGRRLFGSIINRSRDLLRQASTYITGEDAASEEARAEVRRLVTVFFALLRQYLRGERDLGKLGAPITDRERTKLEPVVVRPNVAVAWLTARLHACHGQGILSERMLVLMDQNVTALVDYWGGAERIRKTPIPFAYAHHIKTFLTIFCFSVPFSLVEAMGWGTPFVAALIAFAMFGIEQIGVEIEDPFGHDANDLPLDAMGETVARDTGDIVAARSSRNPASFNEG